MKLGLMQPYFFPYLGYFRLIQQTDVWIVFDTAQHIRRGWVHRNRILHPTTGWQYICVPVKHCDRETSICDVRICDRHLLQSRILAQLSHYRKHAPFYDETMDLVEKCLAGEEDYLARLNLSILDQVCAHVGISFQYRVLSELDLSLGPIECSGDWALRLSQALGAKEYINPPGGVDIYDPVRFADCGVQLTFQDPVEFRYECPGYEFVPGLSIIDVLMWNSRERVREVLCI